MAHWLARGPVIDAQLVELHAVLHEAAVDDYVYVTVRAEAVQEALL